MKKLTVYSALLVSSFITPSVFAHDSDCDVQLNGALTWDEGVLTVTTESKKTVTITPDHHLSVDGKEIPLNKTEQQWVDTYYRNVETAIPMTLDISYDALELASSAVGEAFGELIGEDEEFTHDLDDMFASVRQEMNSHFYGENGQIRFNGEDFDSDGWLSQQWEDRFEDKVEDLVTQSMGKLLMALGSQMLSGGEDIDDFESRMENWGENFEQRIDARANDLESRADALCELLIDIDDTETSLSNNVESLEDLDMLSVTEQKSSEPMRM